MPLLVSTSPTPSGYLTPTPRPAKQTHSSWDRRLNKPSAIPSWALPAPRSLSASYLPLKPSVYTSNRPSHSPYLPDRYDEDDPPSGTDSAGSTFSDVEGSFSPITPPRSRDSSLEPPLKTPEWPLSKTSAPLIAPSADAVSDADDDDDLSDTELAILSSAVIEEVVRVVRYQNVVARGAKPRMVNHHPALFKLPKPHAQTSSTIHRAQQPPTVIPAIPAIPRRSSQRRPSSCSVVDDLPQTPPPTSSTIAAPLRPPPRRPSHASRHSVHLDHTPSYTPIVPTVPIKCPHGNLYPSAPSTGHVASGGMRPEFQTFMARNTPSNTLTPRPAGAAPVRKPVPRHEPSLTLDSERRDSDRLIRITSDISVTSSSSSSHSSSPSPPPSKPPSISLAAAAAALAAPDDFTPTPPTPRTRARRPWLAAVTRTGSTRLGFGSSSSSSSSSTTSPSSPTGSQLDAERWPCPETLKSTARGEITRKITLTPSLLRDDLDGSNPNASVHSLALPAQAMEAKLGAPPGTALTTTAPSSAARLGSAMSARNWVRGGSGHGHRRSNTNDSDVSLRSCSSAGAVSVTSTQSLGQGVAGPTSYPYPSSSSMLALDFDLDDEAPKEEMARAVTVTSYRGAGSQGAIIGGGGGSLGGVGVGGGAGGSGGGKLKGLVGGIQNLTPISPARVSGGIVLTRGGGIVPVLGLDREPKRGKNASGGGSKRGRGIMRRDSKRASGGVVVGIGGGMGGGGVKRQVSVGGGKGGRFRVGGRAKVNPDLGLVNAARAAQYAASASGESGDERDLGRELSQLGHIGC